MRPDNRPEVVHEKLIRPGLRGNHRLDLLNVVEAVSVGDIDRLVLDIDGGFTDDFGDPRQRFLPPDLLLHGDELAVVVDMQDGLDFQRAPEPGGAGGNPSAAFQEVQIVDSEPMRGFQLILFDPLRDFVDCLPLIADLDRLIDDQPFAERGGERVDGQDPDVRILLHDILRRDGTGMIRSAESGAEREVEDFVISLRDNSPEDIFEFRRVDLARP